MIDFEATWHEIFNSIYLVKEALILICCFPVWSKWNIELDYFSVQLDKDWSTFALLRKININLKVHMHFDVYELNQMK